MKMTKKTVCLLWLSDALCFVRVPYSSILSLGASGVNVQRVMFENDLVDPEVIPSFEIVREGVPA